MSVDAPEEGRRFARLRRWWFRLRSAFGVPTYQLREVAQLQEHILGRLRTGGIEPAPLYADWVASRFTYPLRALLWQASRDGRGHVVLNLAVVAGGFATSGLAAASAGGHSGGTKSWIVFGIGLLVAVAGGVSQLFRPGYRATERTTLAVELREEGWAFARGGGDYAGDVGQAFERFDARVAAIHRQAVRITAAQQELSSTSRAAGRRSGGRTPRAASNRETGAPES
jgi:hypothetical protein